MQMCPECERIYDESDYAYCPYCAGILDPDDYDEDSYRPPWSYIVGFPDGTGDE